MSRKFFGTDGVRGVYGGPVMNEAFAARLGFAAAAWMRSANNGSGTAARRVLIGRDTRFSGAQLEAAVARGLRAAGAEPVSLGVLPTPAVARAVRHQRASLGVVITASHNPAEDNGIKFFGPAGIKLTDDEELAIEARLPADVPATGAAFEATDGVADYLRAMSAVLPARALAGWRIVLDTANGATCGTSPGVLRSLGAEVVGIGDAPDGRNINAGVGSEHPEKLAERVRAENARLGVAHDGDGDRCVLCDERGEVLDGDEVIAILALNALRRGRLVNNTVVVTMQSNLGVDAAVRSAGGRVLRTNVGDRYVSEQMIAEGATLGGESSGHIICSEISPTGDGLVAALKVIEVMLETGQPLSELRRALKKFPQASTALRVREKKPLEQLPALRQAIADLERELGPDGRVLVRWSGTEPKLRLLVEGPSDAIVNEGIGRLKKAAAAELPVA
jgi:phosphoglucosamine mutase